MGDEWYYRLFGQEFGPVPFDELAALASSDGLGPGDPVRNGRDGAWVPAAAVRGLFAPLERGAGAGDGAFYLLADDTEYGPIEPAQLQRMAAAGRLRTYHQLRRGRHGEWIPLADAAAAVGIDASLIRSPLPTLPKAPSRAADESRQPIPSSADAAGPAEPATGAIAAAALLADADLAARGSSHRARRHKLPSALAAGLAGVIVVAVVAFLVFRTSDRDYYDAISTLYGQFQTLREQNAAPARWDEWLKHVEERRRELVPELEATAGATSGKVARQHLLFALRDYLAEMHRDSIREAGESERKFTAHMESALAHVEGRTSSPSRRPPPPTRLSGIEVALALTVFVEFAIVLWLGAGLIRPAKRQPG